MLAEHPFEGAMAQRTDAEDLGIGYVVCQGMRRVGQHAARRGSPSHFRHTKGIDGGCGDEDE